MITEIGFNEQPSSLLNEGLSIFSLFKEVAHSFPHKTALSDESQLFTYAEVAALSSAIANQIALRNFDKQPIGIAIESGVYFPIAMLACLANGCPYVPLDVDMPEERNQLILSQSEAKLILTTSNSKLNYDGYEVVFVDQLEPINQEFGDKSTPEDIAYIIYTSGTTGVPKGVFQNQKNLLHDILIYRNTLKINNEDRLTQFYSPSVNGAIRDIYGALLSGASLYIKNLKRSGILSIPDFINQHKITIYHSVPNVFRAFMQKYKEPEYYRSVRFVYLAADRIFSSDIDLFKRSFPKEAKVYTEIGSTEIATVHSEWIIDHKTDLKEGVIPVGYSVDDKLVKVIKEDGTEAAFNETGEIVVSSPFISLGYWKNYSLTAASFSFDNNCNPAIRSFKTGDLGRRAESGLLHFVGRKDSQTKVDGFRIELSEVEGALMSHPLIQRCSVIATNELPNELYAFYQSEEALPSDFLREHLAKSLPSYMIPKKWQWMETLPLSVNYKTDYKSLRRNFLEQEDIEKASLDNVTSEIRKIWIRFSDAYSFDRDLSWSESGSSSLEAVHFIVQLESALSITLPSEWNLAVLKPSDIISYVNKTKIESEKKIQLVYFPPLGGTSDKARAFFRKLSSEFKLYVMHYPSMAEIKNSGYNWKLLETHVSDQLQQILDENTFFLGHCNGSNVLFKYLSETKLDISKRVVGIIDYSYRINTEVKTVIGIAGKIKRLAQTKNRRYRAIGLLYERVQVLRSIIRVAFPSDVEAYEGRVRMRQFFLRSSAKFNGFFFYFYSGGSITPAERENILKSSKEFKFVELSGLHDDILNEENSYRIIKTIKEYQESIS